MTHVKFIQNTFSLVGSATLLIVSTKESSITGDWIKRVANAAGKTDQFVPPERDTSALGPLRSLKILGWVLLSVGYLLRYIT